MKKYTYRDFIFSGLTIFGVILLTMDITVFGNMLSTCLYFVILFLERMFTSLRYSMVIAKLCVSEHTIERCIGSHTLCQLSRDNLEIYACDYVGIDYYVFSNRSLEEFSKKDVLNLAKAKTVIVFFPPIDKIKADFPTLFHNVKRIGR